MKNLLFGKKIVEKKLIWFIIPLVIIIVAAISFGIYAGVNKDASQGMNIGIDFTGGTMVTIKVDDARANFDNYEKEITEIVNNNGGRVSYSQLGEDDTAIIVRYNLVSDEVNNAIKGNLIEKYGDANVKSENIGATASKDLLLTAVGAVSLSTVLILIYIVIRFGLMGGKFNKANGGRANISEGFSTGLASVIALLHDLIMVFAFTIICHIQINSSFVAALITIIAYSINNSIVLFDRVRENTRDIKNNDTVAKALKTRESIVNRSISQTLMRSINTTVTTMAAIVVLAIIGVPSIREFALPVIFGLVAGAFSSIFFAPSLYCVIQGGIDNFKGRDKTVTKAKKSKDKDVKNAKVVENTPDAE